MTEEKKPEVVQRDCDKEVLEILSWTPEERRKALREALTMTATNIIRAAKIVGAMEEAKDDLSEFPVVVLDSLRRIRSGQMLPEVFMNYTGSLMQRIAALPLPDQRHLIEGGKVRLLVEREGKEPEILLQDPTSLQPKQIQQVFGRSRMRTEAEQRAWIEEFKLKRAKITQIEPTVTVDRKRGRLVVRGTVEFSKKELINYLAQLE